MIGTYINGNYRVTIYENGTKIRETLDPNATEFIPEFAENCDVKITDRCDGGCPMCYEGCTPEGKHADLRHTLLNLDTLHPYTEMALNGNDLSHPDLIWFLDELARRKVIANLTVNQIHFEKHKAFLRALSDRGLIHGLGVSLRDPTSEFIKDIQKFPNAVVHVINGIITKEHWNKLVDNNLKVLILGYKQRGRGVGYLDRHIDDITSNIAYTKGHMLDLMTRFRTLAFDNLALQQLSIKSLMSDDEWETLYMGDDGDFTFYMDLVDNTFCRNSVSDVSYFLLDDIDEMFHTIRDEKKREESE